MISQELIENVLSVIEPDEVIQLTASLVKINSVWDPAAGTSEQAAAECAARWAEAQGFQVVMEEVAPGRPNVIVTHAADPGPRTLMFEGHTDVVTPGDVSSWTYDPFGAHILHVDFTRVSLDERLQVLDLLLRRGVAAPGRQPTQAPQSPTPAVP